MPKRRMVTECWLKVMMPYLRAASISSISPCRRATTSGLVFGKMVRHHTVNSWRPLMDASARQHGPGDQGHQGRHQRPSAIEDALHWLPSLVVSVSPCFTCPFRLGIVPVSSDLPMDSQVSHHPDPLFVTTPRAQARSGVWGEVHRRFEGRGASQGVSVLKVHQINPPTVLGTE